MRTGFALVATLGAAVTLLYAACGGDNNASSSVDAGPSDGAKKSDSGNTLIDGGDNDSGALASATVLRDPKIWSLVPAHQSCNLYEGKVVPDPFPQRAWGSCGAGAWASGCQVAVAGLPIETFSAVNMQQSSGALVGADVVIHLSMNFSELDVEQVFRLSDGATVAAARLDNGSGPCFFGSFPNDTPLLMTPMYELPDAGGNTIDLFGVATPSVGAPIAWDQNWVPDRGYPDNPFLIDAGHGYAYTSGEIAMVPSPSATDFTSIVPSPSATPQLASRNDLLVWGLETTTGGGIRAYSASDGLQTLFTNTKTAQRTFPYFVAMSDTRIVWATVTLDDQEASTSLTLSWSPVAKTSAGVSVTSGAPLSKYAPAGPLMTGGDYATVASCENTSDTPNCVLNVIKLSTKKIWQIPQRPGTNVFTKTLAINDDELVVGESDSYVDVQRLRRIVRIKISQLDALAVP